MQKFKRTEMSIATSALLLIAMAVAAQQQGRETVTSPITPQGTAIEREYMAERTAKPVYRASQLIGSTVNNAQGEKLGQIEDVVVDPADATVSYVVLSLGGFLGFGEKYVAIPWNALVATTDTKGKLDDLFLDVDKERLENAPGFDKSNWPNMADPRWGEETHTYYGQQDAWNRRQQLRQQAQTHLESSPAPSMPSGQPSGQGDTSLSAVVQTIHEDKGLLRLRTAEGDSVELQVPPVLATDLQTGDRVEVSIRKRGGESLPSK